MKIMDTKTSTTEQIKELSSHLKEHVTSPRHVDKSCDDIQANTGGKSGVYTITFDGQQVSVFCDMDTDNGGWTVLQKRGDNVDEKEYWLGLRYWNKLTQSENQQLLIIVEHPSDNN